MNLKPVQRGFTLIEIAIVLLVVVILLGYTVAMFPRQQELKQYRAVNDEMDRVIGAITGFAQVNGRLPCPASPVSAGIEEFDNATGDGCNHYGGFVPANTLGLTGRFNADSLLLDPWGNPYRYYVSSTDNGPPLGVPNGRADFTADNGEMRDIGLIDSNGDGLLDLDGQYQICDDNGVDISDTCNGAATVFGNTGPGALPAPGAGPPSTYAGAIFVVLSQGSNWNRTAPLNDELENIGGSLTNTNLGMGVGPSGNEYLLKDVGANQTTFVRRTTGFADDFDDVVRWESPNVLFSKMIEADQLP
jgi:prepilin-type N-terminal cleavage/methylation domain-containing protein